MLKDFMKLLPAAVVALMVIAIIVIVAGVLSSCTENQKARNYGGTETIDLPKGEKLIMATWKGDKGSANLWYLTEPMEDDYIPKQKKFRESSDFGVWEGTVIFNESRDKLIQDTIVKVKTSHWVVRVDSMGGVNIR